MFGSYTELAFLEDLLQERAGAGRAGIASVPPAASDSKNLLFPYRCARIMALLVMG